MLMMLSFGLAFCPKKDDDDADDDRLLAASNLKPLGDINGAGLRPLPSQVHYCAMLTAWDYRRQAVLKSSIASMFEECSWIDGRALYKGCRTHGRRASSSCFRMELGAESDDRQHSLFFGFWNDQRASSASSLLVCR